MPRDMHASLRKAKLVTFYYFSLHLLLWIQCIKHCKTNNNSLWSILRFGLCGIHTLHHHAMPCHAMPCHAMHVSMNTTHQKSQQQQQQQNETIWLHCVNLSLWLYAHMQRDDQHI
jgi:hypothetical protein